MSGFEVAPASEALFSSVVPHRPDGEKEEDKKKPVHNSAPRDDPCPLLWKERAQSRSLTPLRAVPLERLGQSTSTIAHVHAEQRHLFCWQ
jgi:hypothetical protein